MATKATAGNNVAEQHSGALLPDEAEIRNETRQHYWVLRKQHSQQ
jgi:hypothetical protein